MSQECHFGDDLRCVYCGWQARKPKTHRICGDQITKRGALDRLSRWASAVGRWMRAGRPTREPGEIERVHEICRRNECGYFGDGQCLKCGCAVSRSKHGWFNKLAMATESCPVGLWDAAVEDTQAAKLRVGFVVPHLISGGVERWLVDLAANLPAAGVDVAGVAYLGSSKVYVPAIAEELALHCPIVGCVEDPHCVQLPTLAEAVWSITQGSDVVVAWGMWHEQLEALRDAAGGKPVVGVAHGESAWYQSAPWIQDWAAVSQAAAQFAPPGAVVIPNGVNLARLRPTVSRETARDTAGIPADAKVIVSIGRLASEKRLHLAAAALEYLPSDYWLWLVGDGPEADKIRNAAGSRVDRLVISPSRLDVGNVLDAANLFVLCSDGEGYCLAAVEALGVSLPLVATSVGILPEFGPAIDWLPKDPTPQQIAAAVLVSGADDKAEYRQSARDIVHRWHSADSMAKRWATFLQEVVRVSAT